MLTVNDSKQSPISGGKGALLRPGLTLPLPPRRRRRWVFEHVIAIPIRQRWSTHYQRIQEGFHHAVCHPLHTLPCGRSHSLGTLTSSPEGFHPFWWSRADITMLMWEAAVMPLKEYKPSKTLNGPQTHFKGLPPKTERSSSGNLPGHVHLNLSLYYPTALSVLWVSFALNG